MQQIVELKIEETKAVVGGVSRIAAPVAHKGEGPFAEIFRDIIRVIEKDLGLGLSKMAEPARATML